MVHRILMITAACNEKVSEPRTSHAEIVQKNVTEVDDAVINIAAPTDKEIIEIDLGK